MKVITFGEIMLRLAPEGYDRFFQNDRLQATFGGGEANVAVSLANYGVDAAFVTKLPEGPIGQGAVNTLRGFGVDVSKITRGGERLGIYYLEKGASQRGSLCIYDRAHSAISEASASDFDWNAIFADANWFHFTGITPALSEGVAAICLTACRTAKEKGLTVSCDLNYRKKLWSTARAREVMSELMQYVDICIANEEDADKVLGIRADGSDVESGKLNVAGYRAVAEEICRVYGCRAVAITLRKSYSASRNGWGAVLYDSAAATLYESKEYDMQIVDRVGGGDSFGAGIICGYLRGLPMSQILEFAVAASCLKHSIEGDFNRVTVAEVEALMKGNGSGRVAR